MKSKALACLFAVLAIVALGIVSVLAAEPTLPPGYTWYQNDEFKFKIGIPDTWVRTPEEQITCTEPTLHVTIFYSQEFNGGSVVIEVDSSEAITQWEDSLIKEPENVTEVVINGRDAYEVITEGVFPPLNYRYFVFVVEDRLYMVTFNWARDFGEPAAYDNIINSFIIEYPEPTPEKGELDFPGFEAIVAIVGLLTVGYLVKRRG